ncbi:MAG: sigma-70 family RNA polymerase sigma factor [Chloroflexota bacterium]|nr:sigma-70 family RNA polymerase sigma factor [Chloroflexota bacterium]
MKNVHGPPSLFEDHQEDEATLIEAARANPAAFEGLYQRYVARVYRYLRTRVGQEEDAADLTQQVFLKALNALPSYQERGSPFAAWLFRIARHTLTDTYRQRRDDISWDILPDVMIIPGREQDPEEIILRQESLVRLRCLLEGVDGKKRELLALRFAAGLSTAEIALVVNKSQASVKKQLTRILSTLKEQY